MSGNIYPYKAKNKFAENDFDKYENIEKEDINESDEGPEKVVILNDGDEVNKLAQELIPSSADHYDSKQEAANEMGEKVKGYFENNPNEATKILKTMLKKENK